MINSGKNLFAVSQKLTGIIFGLCVSFFVNADTITAPNSTTINLTIINSCKLNGATGPTTINLGTLNFGSVSGLTTNIDSQTLGINGIRVSCTPGTPIAIKINQGLHGTGTTRYMRKPAPSVNLSYQVYTDEARTQPWNNNLGLSHSFTNNTEVSFPIYGRVFAQTTPSAGVYTDTLTVTVEY